MERDDEASLEDLRLLLQKERVVFSITSTSRHVIFATIFTPRVVSQKAVNTRSVNGQSVISQRSVSGLSTDDRPTLFSFLRKVPYVSDIPYCQVKHFNKRTFTIPGFACINIGLSLVARPYYS